MDAASCGFQHSGKAAGGTRCTINFPSHVVAIHVLQDMADAAGRAAASDILARLLAQPELWATGSTDESGSNDGGAAAFGGGAWAGALAELAAKVCTQNVVLTSGGSAMSPATCTQHQRSPQV